MDWNQEANGYRLPSEHEWEWAARARSSFEYSGSNDLDHVAWCEGNSAGHTHPVGYKKANRWGFCDLSGNVEEWCQNLFKTLTPDPYQYTNHGRDWRSRRGCGWGYSSLFASLGSRRKMRPFYRDNCLGLRVLKPTKSVTKS